MFFLYFIQILKDTSVSKQWRTCFAASDLILHCLPMSHKKDVRPIYGLNLIIDQLQNLIISCHLRN